MLIIRWEGKLNISDYNRGQFFIYYDLDIQNEVYSTWLTGDKELTHERSINTAASESKEDVKNCEDFHVSEKENLKQIWIFLKHEVKAKA